MKAALAALAGQLGRALIGFAKLLLLQSPNSMIQIVAENAFVTKNALNKVIAVMT